MATIKFQLKEEFIPLIQLLKYTNIAESGAHASEMVVDGSVYCNGQVETRKRYKVKSGDIIVFENETIEVK
jgi:ribosome-associated protein